MFISFGWVLVYFQEKHWIGTLSFLRGERKERCGKRGGRGGKGERGEREREREGGKKRGGSYVGMSRYDMTFRRFFFGTNFF